MPKKNDSQGKAHFAQMIKIYGNYGQHEVAGRYSPAPMIETIVRIRDGRPDPRHISTSFIERQNLTMRQAIRRFTRLTNAFSKKLDNLKAACALHFAYYNSCRIHKTLRCTPAMEANITSQYGHYGNCSASLKNIARFSRHDRFSPFLLFPTQAQAQT